jgi:hypothetical protein
VNATPSPFPTYASASATTPSATAKAKANAFTKSFVIIVTALRDRLGLVDGVASASVRLVRSVASLEEPKLKVSPVYDDAGVVDTGKSDV